MIELNKLYLKDCIEGMKEIESNSVDVVLADPPYNIGKDFGNESDRQDFQEYLIWCQKWIDESIRILKPNGTLYIYGFSEILAHISVRLTIPNRWLIWHYTNKNTPHSKFWQRSHESIIIAWKEKPHFNLDDVREPYTDVFLKNAAGKVRKATKGRFSKTDQETIYQAHDKGALPRDVLKVPALAGGAGGSERWFLCIKCQEAFKNESKMDHETHGELLQHPTQKPYALTERLLLAAKPKENGIVVIPFLGSGSEVVVAKNLKMNFIGFEINKNYLTLATSFIKKFKKIK
jgi:site-specific DNA-methyltransferase (adenine-specific)